MTGQQATGRTAPPNLGASRMRYAGPLMGWDFKQFVLGALFYRFISENFTSYIEAGDESIDYAGMSDADITR